MAKLFIILTVIVVSSASSIRKISPEEAERLANWNEGDKQDVWELSGQFEGDMIINEKERNGLIAEVYKWPDNTIPYVFDDAVTEEQKDFIIDTLKIFEEVSCVKTRPKEEQDGNYVYITNEDTGCWSHVGRQAGKQQLNFHSYTLGKGCFRRATIIHEFLHAFGFYHQQSSTERDDYVDIKWENIKEGKEGNFNKYTSRDVTNYGEKYDYGEKTIVPKNPSAKIGQRDGMSEIDIAKLNKMYVCNK